MMFTKILTIAAIGLALLNAMLISTPSRTEALIGAATMVGVPQGGTGFSSTSPNSLIAGGSTATGRLVATSSPTVNIITATSTTATSTFANGIELTGGCVKVAGSCIVGGSSFAWTPTSDGNSTSTTIIFGNGFISQASSSISNIFSVTGLSTLSGGLLVNKSTSTISFLTTTSATTTNATTSQLAVSGLASTSALSVNGAFNVFSSATGTFVGGVAMNNLLLTSPLNVSYGGTGAASFAAGNILYGSGTNALAVNSNLFWDSSNLRLGIGTGTPAVLLSVHGDVLISGTTTHANMIATGTQNYRGASNFILPPSASSTAAIGIDATQLKFTTGNGQVHNITGTSTRSFNIGSTTLDAMGNKFSSGTSTFLVINDSEPLTMIGFYCVASTTGTALVRFGDPTGNFTEVSTCTTGSFTRTVTNNTWTSFEGVVIQASSTAGTVNRITISPTFNRTAD